VINHGVAEKFLFDGFGSLDDFVFVHRHFGIALAEALVVQKILQAVGNIELPDVVWMLTEQALMRRGFEHILCGDILLPQAGDEAVRGHAARADAGIVQDHLCVAGGQGNFVGFASGCQHKR